MATSDWLEPWEAVPPEQAPALEAELERELAPGHVLHGRRVRAIARRIDEDDALFELLDEEGCVLVHLTWTGRRAVPPFPTTSRYTSLSAWKATEMLEDHRAYSPTDA